VTVNELIVGVNIALETLPVDECAALDVNGDGAVTVNELVQGVNNALQDCGGGTADSTRAQRADGQRRVAAAGRVRHQRATHPSRGAMSRREPRPA
jgi:hypothetical protein